MKLINLVGQRFGRLVVIERASSDSKNTKWRCQCDCGKQCDVYGYSLKSNNTRSCGCYKAENAKMLYSTVRQNDKGLYAVWNGIKQRCTNKNSKSYHNYGGRGIKIDDKWANSYEEFYNWAIKSGYRKGLQIDRIDNDGDYCESNCRFVSKDIQANNKRNVKLYTIKGITKSLPQWCKEYDMEYFLVRQRVFKLGWSLEDALSCPSRYTRKEKQNG